MNGLAIDFLVGVYKIPRQKIIRIEHGVPDFELLKDKLFPVLLKLIHRKIILTFGLIGRSKGIETVIKALPNIVNRHPEVMYVIAGKTHPHVVCYAGEEYRDFLQQLVKNLNLEEHVLFINEYLSELELMSYLKRADLYVTPYLNKAQITSGTLSYAISGGCAVLSTPYWHAEELLADDRGLLFEFGDYHQLSEMINELLDDPVSLKQLQQKAYDYGRTITWTLVGKAYLNLFDAVIMQDNPNNFLRDNEQKIEYPDFDLTHLQRLTDDTGLLQHARTSVPCYKAGYCLDDNARALIVSLSAWKKTNDPHCLVLMNRYLAFTAYMQRKDGNFKNYMTFERTLLDDTSDDAFGRTIWALGFLIRYAPNNSVFHLALEIFEQSLCHLNNLSFARGYANCILGLYHYLKRFPDQEKFMKLLEKLSDQLCEKFLLQQPKKWNWFEDSLTYDNGLMPAALYLAYEILGSARYLKIADESRILLESKCFREDWLSLIGNRRWLRLDHDYDIFAQQPIDAMAMVVLYQSAWKATGNREFIDKLRLSFDWFFGKNDLNISLFDPESKGCNDGIEPFNINLNQGAESNIAYLLSRLIAEPFLN